MKLQLLCGLALVASAAVSVSPDSADVYVDPVKGSDSGDGSAARPFQTLAKTQTALRSLEKKTAVVVHLAAGATFTLLAPLNFSAADSGNVRWVGEGSAGVTVSGGVRLPTWTKKKATGRVGLTAPPPPPTPNATCPAFPVSLYNMRCAGFSSVIHVKTLDECKQACCNAGIKQCTAFQLWNHEDCFLFPDLSQRCHPEDPTWDGGSVHPLPPPPPPPPPSIVWTAPVPAKGAQSRHLFYNGQRANRTKTKSWSVGSSVSDAGYSFTDPTFCAVVKSWPNPGSVEFVYVKTAGEWTESRVTVKNVTFSSKGGCAINMAQPAFHNIQHKPAQALSPRHATPSYIENDGVSKLEIGDFYVDVAKAVVYLGAAESADLTSNADVVAPVLEVLLHAEALEGHTFSNIHFMHATWLQPSGPVGYVEQQSGCIASSNGTDVSTPGNIQLEHCTAVSFRGCSFTHLGAIGIDISKGSHDCIIDDCFFEDISAAGVQIGGYKNALATNPAEQDLGNAVTNSVLQWCAIEYAGHVGLIVGYAANTVISHNRISNLTYGGVSVGWGWTTYASTFATNNTISHNDIGPYKSLLQDGGGIYMLGPQNNSRIFNNYVHDQLDGGATGALYPDQGSAYSQWYSNVVERTHGATWLHIWTRNIHDVKVYGNYADTPNARDQGTRCPVSNTTIYAPGNRTAEAQLVILASGPPQTSRWLAVTAKQNASTY